MRKDMKAAMLVVLMTLLANISPTWAYYSYWVYSATAEDKGIGSDGGYYTFRYDDEDTKKNFMDFRTYQIFDASVNRFKWNWDIRVNYGTVDDKNFTNIVVTIEDAAGNKRDIAEADFQGNHYPTVAWSKRPVYFSKIAKDGEYKYMFTLEYQPTEQDLKDGVKRIYICGRTEWDDGNKSRHFQYERDLDISSYLNMTPEYSIELDNEGNYVFEVKGVRSSSLAPTYISGKRFYGKVSYGNSQYSEEWTTYNLTEDYRTGGSLVNGDYTFTIPVKSYTVPLRISQLDYIVDARRQTAGSNSGDEHYNYSVQTSTGNAYNEGILFMPYTRVNVLTAEFDKWKKKNIIQWTRNEKTSDKVGNDNVEVECLTDGAWYVLRYEKEQGPTTYEVLKTISGNSSNLKVEDSDIEYDMEYVYRIVFLPNLLQDKYADKLVNLPGETSVHSEYDLWEETVVNTKMEVPIKLAQDRSDDTGIHLTWEYNVQATGCEWRIDKRPYGATTWTPVTTIPVDTKQSVASYLDEGGSVCDRNVYRIMTKVNNKELYSDTLACNLPSGAYISEVTASTGTEEKYVEVKWKVARPGDDDISFHVLRRLIGSDEWTQLTTVGEIHGTASEYTYKDDRVMAGSYYEYSVEAYGARCEGQLVQTDQQIIPGFSQARGTITGHISYGTGTAVAGVRVNLVKSEADEGTSQPQFLSRYIDGEGKGLTWKAGAKDEDKLNGKKSMTLQLWAKPLSTDNEGFRSLLTLTNCLELGMNSDDGKEYYLQVIDLVSDRVAKLKTLTFAPDDFTHVAAVYNKTSWTFYVGTDTLRTDSVAIVNTNWNAIDNDKATLTIGSSNRSMGTAFSGYVDDVRLWKRALSQKEIEGNYTRILGGTDNGLILYWPLDEGINMRDYAFDVAKQDGIYQLNHPEVGANALPSSIVPKLLGLYGVTDAEGDYIIRGIPFLQGGTNYKLVPALGIHEFSPSTRSMFVSPTSLTANNIDFEDVSSFPMEGYVYYAGTNIPAQGIMLYVDGELLTTGGAVSQTDANGYYKISVPIGNHYVEAKAESHKMVDGGRFPTKGLFNFDRKMQHDFADSTLVNFIGRVSGGERNDTLAVGFGASNNNIGMAVITLRLNNESFSFNCQEDHITSATTNRPWASDTTSIASRSWSGTGYDAKYVFIRTDSLTGEFSAMLPPLKYTTKSVKIDSNLDIEFTSLPEIDLTNPLQVLNDSLCQPTASGDSMYAKYKYHTKQKWVHYAQPQIDMWEVGSTHRKAFGMKDYEGEDAIGTYTIHDLWTQEADGTIKYKFDYPIYQTGDKVTMKLRGYEAYMNYDGVVEVADTLPLSNQVLTIANEMSTEQKVLAVPENPETSELKAGDVVDLKLNQLALDADGMGSFYWTTGVPTVTAPYTRQLSSTFERNKRVYLGPQLNAVVLGSLASGSNFVTKGPDDVLMVLHDPPGAKSKTTWTRGTTKTKVRSTSHGFFGDEKVFLETKIGVRLNYISGMGFLVETLDVDNTTDVKDGFHYTVNKNWKKEETWSLTTTEAISTSSGSGYVGSSGDVFIGVSKNLLLGECRKVGFFRENPDSPFELKVDNALSLGDSVATTFMYSARELETVMIPKWKETRNSLLNIHVANEDQADIYVNNGSEVAYVTWLSEDDANFGKEGTYRMVAPQSWDWDKNRVIDNEVQWCNNQIDRWNERLRNNEEDKVKAMENESKYWQRNISFDGGSGYTYSSRCDTTNVTTHNYTHNLGYLFKLGSTWHNTAAAVQFHAETAIETENGWTMATTESDMDENEKNYAEFVYTFDDGNWGTDFSVNIYNSPTGWGDIFSVFGGQSYNPYEGPEYTKHYMKKNGEPYLLSNGTLQMEQPDIRISTDGKVGAKTAVLTDVPAGQTGQFTLHLSNNSTANWDRDFSYNLIVIENTDSTGLQVYMDGVPADGRAVMIPAGETIKKTITVQQTDHSILDYEGIKIRFASQFQPLDIFDEVSLSVHFKPSSSLIELVINEPIVNTASQNATLEMKLTNFDRQFKNLKNVGVEYRFEGNTQWTPLHTYVTNIADSTNNSFSLLPPTGDLRLTANMSNNTAYPDGTYTFRGFTTTPYGTEDIRVYSEEVKVIKDMVRPTYLTTPTPTNGILTYGDQLSVEFNEDIVSGYVGDKNIIVTAKLNNQPVNHDVALQLMPYGESAHTENPIFLNGDFSVDFWVKWTQSGILFRLGKGFSMMTWGIDFDGKARLSMVGNTYLSEESLPMDTWTFVVMSFNASDMTISMQADYGTESVQLFDRQPITFSAVDAINYADDNRLYLGCGITGAIHDLSLYNIYRDVNEAAATKYRSKNNYVYGLTNYWPMNEGHGTTANDARHTHNFIVNNRWEINNVNYKLALTNVDDMSADISRINTSAGDSYAIEMWTSVYSGACTLFETGSNTSNKLCLRYDDAMNIVLDYADKSQVVASHEDFPNHNIWHHVALNVVRGQAASFYYDGKRTAVISEHDIPVIAGSRMKLASHLNGGIDEVRVWQATLTESRLLANMYNCIDTTDVYSRGLVLYYPFEKAGTVNGVQAKVETLEDMAPGSLHTPLSSVSSQLPYPNRYGAPLKNAPEETRLIASPIASERKIVIDLSGITATPRDIEGTTLNITVADIRDMHGNASNPIKWTAYVQQNTLKWTKDSVNIIKQYGDSYTFDVDIENKSGMTEYYTLYNMPIWLTLVDSEQSDDVGPLKKKTLRFQVNPLVAVGNYDITIGIQGNNEILEPLRIIMKVRGQKPDWSVNPNDYENTMSVVGQIFINGILMGSNESLLAAFIGDECRGLVSPKPMRGATYVVMSVYGTAQQTVNGQPADLDKGQPVTFRIWDATTGMTYTNVNVTLPDGTTTDAVTFDPVESYGTFDNPLIFTKSNIIEQPLNIRTGWNWLALGIEPVNPKTSAVFKDLVTWDAQLKDQGTGIAYCHGSYWAGTMKEVHANTMYKLQLTRMEGSSDLPQPLTINGQQVKLDETPVTLHKEWNWLAYTPMMTLPIAEALAGANPHYGDQVKSQTGFAYYGPYGWEGNLEALESGKGYLYFSTDNVEKQFVYPTVSSSSRLYKPNNAKPAQSVFSPVEPTHYPDNMAIVIMLVDGEQPVTDAEVAAFIDGECRGAAFADEDLYYLLVAGEGSGQPIEIRANINGTVQTVCTSLTYASDGSIGTPWEPFIIDINDPSGIKNVQSPMVDGVWYTLQGIRYGTDRPTASGIYIYNRKKVVIRPKKKVSE